MFRLIALRCSEATMHRPIRTLDEVFPYRLRYNNLSRRFRASVTPRCLVVKLRRAHR
jgi:hypothetical protein